MASKRLAAIVSLCSRKGDTPTPFNCEADLAVDELVVVVLGSTLLAVDNPFLDCDVPTKHANETAATIKTDACAREAMTPGSRLH